MIGVQGQPQFEEGPRVHDMAQVGVNEFLMRVFAWMAAGLLLTGSVAAAVASSPITMIKLWNSGLVTVLMIGELVLAYVLSSRLRTMSPTTCMGLFLAYSFLNGVTLSGILWAYTAGSVAGAFITCSATFAAMCVYGYTTRKDLSSMGALLFMGLIGLIVAGLVNMFLRSAAMDFVLALIGVVIFVGLTAWDMQKLKVWAQQGFGSKDNVQRLAIMGALMLYLDFINLFLQLLRLFGRRRD